MKADLFWHPIGQGYFNRLISNLAADGIALACLHYKHHKVSIYVDDLERIYLKLMQDPNHRGRLLYFKRRDLE